MNEGMIGKIQEKVARSVEAQEPSWKNKLSRIVAGVNTEKKSGKYPDALSRDMMEGGYTFLHRVFRKNIKTGKPVVIDSGGNYFQYKYEDSHQSFSDGITLLEGNPDGEAYKATMGVIDTFGLDLAKKESGLF